MAAPPEHFGTHDGGPAGTRDLQQALNCASAEYGGGGGGHKIAAGAYIPKTAEEEFVIRVNRILGEQFAAAGSGNR